MSEHVQECGWSMKRAALYARVSTSDHGQDPENQLLELRRFATAQGWDVTAEFVEYESGASSSRPQFQAMMAAAARREFDVLVFWSLDRLSREGAGKTLQILNQLTSWGVAYRSFTEPYLDSAGVFSEAIIAILATLAKQERVRLQERIKAGLARARENGTASGREIGRPRIILDRDRVASLRAQGLSWSKISQLTGHRVTTMRMALKSYRRPCGNLPAKQAS